MSNMVSDLLFYAAKKKWPKGLEVLPDLLTRAANALSAKSEPSAWLVRRYANDGSWLSDELYLKKPHIGSTARTDFIPLYAYEHRAILGRVIPEGWRLVPDVLTPEMSTELNLTGDFSDKAMQARYDAALKRAPLPPAETIPAGWERRPERYDNYPWTVELESDGWHLRNLQRLGMYREVSLHPTALDAMKAVPVNSESSR